MRIAQPTGRSRSTPPKGIANAAFESKERVRFRGQVYEFPVREFLVNDLKLDPDNPRFAHLSIIRHGSMTQAQMADEIWADSRTRDDLYNSVKVHGVVEKPWIREDGLVFEGNQRTVVLRKLRERANNGELKAEGVGPGDFDRVLCVILPRDTPSDLIRRQMGIWHIGQKQSWPAAAEAKFIYEALERSRLEDVAADFGRSTPYLLQKKWAYERMKEFMDCQHHGNKAEESQYSYFEELYKQRKPLVATDVRVRLLEERADGRRGSKYVPVDSGMERFHRWITSGKFESLGAKGLRPPFVEILKNDAALKAFEQKGIRSAIRLIEDVQPGKSDPHFAILDEALAVLRKMNVEGAIYRPGTRRHAMFKELDDELHHILRLAARLKGAA